MEDIMSLNPGEQSNAAGPAGCLPAEEYLWQNYRLRHNVLSGKVEYRNINEDDSSFRDLGDRERSSIILRSRRDGYVGKEDIAQDIKLIVESADIPKFDPSVEYFNSLEWDGKERLVDFWKRIPGITGEMINYNTMWMRGIVAQCLGLNADHGNECVCLLIGAQGCGKTTFFKKMLPEQLQPYYLNDFRLKNQFDKDMTLTNNILCNMDEFDKNNSRQQANIKQALSTVVVNTRPIYGHAQEVRHRKASFCGTSNCERPLNDPTGSRRFLCNKIPEGQFIDNITPIEYDQIYAQLVYEVKNGFPYWFSNDEVERIQKINVSFNSNVNLEMIIDHCVRHLEDGESESYISTDDIINKVKESYPNVTEEMLVKSKIGKTMKQLGFVKKRTAKKELYIASFRPAS